MSTPLDRGVVSCLTKEEVDRTLKERGLPLPAEITEESCSLCGEPIYASASSRALRDDARLNMTLACEACASQYLEAKVSEGVDVAVISKPLDPAKRDAWNRPN